MTVAVRVCIWCGLYVSLCAAKKVRAERSAATSLGLGHCLPNDSRDVQPVEEVDDEVDDEHDGIVAEDGEMEDGADSDDESDSDVGTMRPSIRRRVQRLLDLERELEERADCRLVELAEDRVRLSIPKAKAKANQSLSLISDVRAASVYPEEEVTALATLLLPRAVNVCV